ncbi:MAG TPA: amidohydrolase family protein [Acidimicrobiales bacterium]|nr:amidohydrolase family protein [Acidimicrobiales bacterium]
MLDLVLRGGLVVDGSGSPGHVDDVGVRDGLVVSVGGPREDARQVVDATELVVAPGFVDIHTHYDAQIQWDPLLSPSSAHGTTTLIGGNCGFTLAPMAEAQADYLVKMLAAVEGMPLAALQAGVRLDWSSFGAWLDGIEGRTALNVGFLAGHSTLRRLVMADAAGERAATEAEIARMASLLAESVDAGALGFSSSWNPAHSDGDSLPVPSRAAALDELVTLAGVLRSRPGTVVEFVPGLSATFERPQIEAMIAMSRAADRSLNWNLLRLDEPDFGIAERCLAPSTEAGTSGAAVYALTNPEPLNFRVTFSGPLVLDNLPGWLDTMRLPVPQRIEALSDPDRRRHLERAVDDASPLSGVLGLMAGWGRLAVGETFSAANEGLVGRTVGQVAQQRGSSPFDTMLDIALADDLRTYFVLPRRGDDDETWRLRAQVWRDPRTVLGGSDAGAHLDLMCGASYTTALLGEGVRERGLLPLEEAVQLLTDAPARFYGIRGRGRIAEGYHADLAVFDPARIASGPIHTRDDLPAGASRLYRESIGIEHVFVNGTEVVHDNEATGDLPGTVLRSYRDFDTRDVASHAAALRG